MRFIETDLPGAFLVEPDIHPDDRGYFARTFCREEFDARGLVAPVAQANVSFNHHAGTLRGLHFQFPPAVEAKLVRCTRGAVFDVIVDLRPESPTFLRHLAVELTAGNQHGLYVPERFAHGYQVLEDQTETTYLISAPYAPAAAGGLAFDDPRLGIAWPLPIGTMSGRDRTWTPLRESEPALRARLAVAA